jgi:hypothetical protein
MLYPSAKLYFSAFSSSNSFIDLLSYTGLTLEYKSFPKESLIPGLACAEVPSMKYFMALLKIALKNDVKRDQN